MDLQGLWQVILYLIVAAGICALLWWLVDFATEKGVMKAPFTGFAQVFIAVVAVALLINLLLTFVGTPFWRWR